MRSVKTTGGLTRGRGMTEIQRLTWVMSMPACAAVNNAMQELTDKNFNTSEQHNVEGRHKDTTKAMMERDYMDTLKLIEYLSSRNPFGGDLSLHSIATGMVCEENVNCDSAREVGTKIITSLIGQNAHEFSFEKKKLIRLHLNQLSRLATLKYKLTLNCYSRG